MEQNASTEGLYQSLSKLIEGGNQENIKKFFIERIKEFPVSEQEDIMMAFLEDALDKEKTEDDALVDFQNKALEIFKKLGEQKKNLEDRNRLIEMKESL